MKIADIRPGLFYALPANEVPGFGGWRSRGGHMLARGTAAHVAEGRHAAPCRVIAVGKFRRRQAGACAYEVTEDHYTTTVHVQVPDVQATITNVRADHNDDRRMGFPAGLSLNSKKIVWVDQIVAPTRIVMPWSDFLKRHEELAFAQAEIEALSERRAEVQKELHRLVLSESGLANAAATDVRVQLGTVRKDGTFAYRSVEADHVKIQCDYVIPLSAFEAAGPLLREIEDLDERMSCRR